MATEGTKDFVRVILGYFLPPVGVFLQVGLGIHFWINLVLVLLGGIPGVIHAMWVIASIDEDGNEAPEAMATFIALLLAGFLPPVAVAMRAGLGMAVLNAVLCLLFWIPGMLHAVWVVTHANTAEA